MVKKKELMYYLDDYLESCRVHGESTLNGNYKEGNKAYKKIDKIFNIPKNSDDQEVFYLEVLEKSNDANTLTWCCINMLKLNINLEIASAKLKEIASDDNIHPIFKSNAQLTLQKWDEGNIKPII